MPKFVVGVELTGRASISKEDLAAFVRKELMSVGLIDADSPFSQMHITVSEYEFDKEGGLMVTPPAILCPNCVTVFGKPSEFAAHFPCASPRINP